MNSPNSHLDAAIHAQIFSEKIIPESGLNQFQSHERPKAILIGGQPGAGKGGLADTARTELSNDAIKIDPDELRKHHPDVERFRKAPPTLGRA